MTTHGASRQPDRLFAKIADYVFSDMSFNQQALQNAHYCLIDSIGCALLALRYPACVKHLGPVVPGTIVPHGARVPGTNFVLDPIKAAFDIGCLVRWLDFNDTWLAKEWGHPSDNLGGILAVCDYLCRHQGGQLQVHDVLRALIKAYEIQGILALDNSFNAVGLDHVILVKCATAAVVTQLLGGDKNTLIRALSQVFVDGNSLRTYRHAPNTGSRKSWAAGDATSRGVRLAWMSCQGEMGYPTALSADVWGFEAVTMAGSTLTLARPLASYVMEHILFKISFPAEFHAQTAVECALTLHHQYKNKLADIERIEIQTQQPAMRIINKTGPLYNPADRDHCLQYMVAVALWYGELTAEHYENKIAANPVIDALREKMVVTELPRFTADYYDADKRAIGNSVQLSFADGTQSEQIVCEYPVGHPRRREEGIPLLLAKCENNLAEQFPAEQVKRLMALFADPAQLADSRVDQLMDALVIP